ncbi:MAG: serine/threonine protein kinase [Planctomycetaceae bacterium]|jgi:serine/threonine protein kinase
MISFLQKFRKSVAASTGKRNFEQTVPAEERSLVSKVIWDWPEGEPVRVDAALEQFPQLLETPRAIVELAIEEFNERRSAGEQLSATEFAGRFPDVQSQLLDSLVFEKALQEMTGWFQSVLAPKEDNVQWPSVGDQIAGFKLVEPLGRGGFSRVFVARELGYENRKVAVKICRQDTHEARTLATLTHSGIGAVHYVRQIPETGMTAICMPLTSRSTLNDVLRRASGGSGRPTSASLVWDEIRTRNKIDSVAPAWASKTFATWARDLMSNLAEALAASHAQNIVHCDLKPTNVLVTPEGKPTLVDFNVAFRQNAVASPANVGGTLPYMAPEQIRAFAGKGFSTIGPQTDVYGLAATIYELLTGRLPFGAAPPADDGVQMLLERRREIPESIRSTNPQVTPEFDRLILECLSYEPEQRPQSAEALIGRLTKVAHGVSDAPLVTKRDSILKMTVATAALILAVAFVPLNRTQDTTNNSLGIGDTGAIVKPELTPDAKLKQLLADGYDAFQAKDFETAEQLFLKAKQLDEGHEGAIFGWIRTNFHLGNVEVAERATAGFFNDGAPEKAALSGLCHAGIESHPLAIIHFEDAIARGFRTPEVLTNLGFSLYRSGKYDKAVEVLEEVRQLGGDTTIANLLQVLSYSHLWHERDDEGRPLHKFDKHLIVSLIEECRDSPVKFKVASELYGSFVMSLEGGKLVANEEWAERSIEAFRRGLEAGLDPAYWNGIKGSMPQSILATDEAKLFTAQAKGRHSAQHRTFFLLDPIIGTRFDRWTERKLTAVPVAGPSQLMATNAD